MNHKHNYEIEQKSYQIEQNQGVKWLLVPQPYRKQWIYSVQSTDLVKGLRWYRIIYYSCNLRLQ